MIFYFTGTGNSLEVAQIIAKATEDTLMNIGEAYKYKAFDFTLGQEEDIGFVFPTYGWSTPPIVDGFIKHASFRDEKGDAFTPGYCYIVLTCGAFVGSTARFFAERLKREHGYSLDASFSVKTVGNCVYLYAPAEGRKRDLLLENARKQATDIASELRRKSIVHKENRNPFGIIMSSITGKDDKPRSTKEFYTLATCTSCGHCAEICPTNTITLIDKKPRWAEMGCTQCLSCLHRCPPHAIQYGKSTETRGRYINPVLLEQD